jgi:type II secretory pathway pseudopilin PulG
MRSGRRNAGFTYVTALILIALMGVFVTSVVETWSHARQREKEAELVWIGQQFRQAIGLYYQRSPGAVKRYPQTLDEILVDPRFPNVQRYLRRIYADPMTGKPDWVLLPAPAGGVMGVRSSSSNVPIRDVASGTKYSDWTFTYVPPLAPAAAASPKAPVKP